MKKNIKNSFYLLLVALITIVLPSCSKDEEGEGEKPESTYQLKLESTDNDLTQDGSITIKFTVEPVETEINSACISINEEDNSPIKVTGLSPENNGVWKVQAKVTDFTCINAKQTVTLTTQQKEGATSNTKFTLNDPYAINDKYNIEYPYTISYLDPKNDKIIGLPIIITATNADDLAIVNSTKIKVTNSDIISDNLPADKFMLTPIENEKGILLAPKSETVDKLKATPEAYHIVNLNVWVTGANERSTHFPIQYILSSQSKTVTNDNLTVSVSELATSGFDKTVPVDVTSQFKHLGFLEKGGVSIKANDINLEEIGFYNVNGTEIEEGFMFVEFKSNPSPLSYDIYNHNVNFSNNPDDQTTYTAGSYNYIIRYTLDWKCNGKTYPRICGNLKYAVTLK